MCATRKRNPTSTICASRPCTKQVTLQHQQVRLLYERLHVHGIDVGDAPTADAVRHLHPNTSRGQAGTLSCARRQCPALHTIVAGPRSAPSVTWVEPNGWVGTKTGMALMSSLRTISNASQYGMEYPLYRKPKRARILGSCRSTGKDNSGAAASSVGQIVWCEPWYSARSASSLMLHS